MRLFLLLGLLLPLSARAQAPLWSSTSAPAANGGTFTGLTLGDVPNASCLGTNSAGLVVSAACLTSAVASFDSRTGAVTLSSADITGAGGALLASPTFGGTLTTPALTLSGGSLLSAACLGTNSGGAIVATTCSGGGGSYTLPAATTTALGGIEYSATNFSIPGGVLTPVFGIAAGTFAQGNDARITGADQSAAPSFTGPAVLADQGSTPTPASTGGDLYSATSILTWQTVSVQPGLRLQTGANSGVIGGIYFNGQTSAPAAFDYAGITASIVSNSTHQGSIAISTPNGGNISIAGATANTQSNTNEYALGGNNSQSGNIEYALGGNSTQTASTSVVVGYKAGDNGMYGGQARTSNDINTQGDAEEETVYLMVSGAGTSALRGLTNGASAGAANCANLPAGFSAIAAVNIVATDHTTVGKNEAWIQWTGLYTRPSTVASTTWTATATPTPLSNGTVTGSSAAISADTTNGCLSVSFTPPTSNTDTWDIFARVHLDLTK